jgi:hypothetical protein
MRRFGGWDGGLDDRLNLSKQYTPASLRSVTPLPYGRGSRTIFQIPLSGLQLERDDEQVCWGRVNIMRHSFNVHVHQPNSL